MDSRLRGNDGGGVGITEGVAGTAAAGAMLFSFVNALQLQIKVIGADIPSEFAVMAPYVITIIALVFAAKRQEQPTALTRPYERGE